MADLLVVGAGIIGLSCAFEAASRGMSVLVVDRDAPASGASGVAAGMLAPLAEAHDMPDDLLRISAESASMYPDFIARVSAHGGDPGFLNRGTLLVAADRDQAGDLAQLERAHERLGMAAERLSVREVLARESRISARISGGLWCPDDRAVDPGRLCAALVVAIEALGGVVRSGVLVMGVTEGGVTAQIDGAQHVLQADRVLLAAGLATSALAKPFVDIPMRPVKGQVLVLRGEPLIGGVVRSPRVYLVPRGDRLVVGASEEEMGDHDQPLAGVTMDLLYEAWRVLPGIYDLELERIVVGHRPSTRDGRPVVRAAGPDGLFIATGHHRHGILLAPWTAGVMGELLVGDG